MPMYASLTTSTYNRKVVAPDRRGVASAELAVLAPFLALFLVGMFEIGRAVMVAEILEGAARKGCNTGIRPGLDYSDITSDVNGVLTANNISTQYATITVEVATCTNSTSNPPTWGSFATVASDNAYNPRRFDLVSVQVQIPAFRVLWFNAFFLTNMNIKSSTVIMARAT